MANTFVLDLRDAVRNGFGYTQALQPFVPPGPPLQGKQDVFQLAPARQVDEALGRAMTGLPYFDEVRFLPITYPDINSRNELVDITTPEVHLPAAIIDPSASKIGVKRQPVGRKGTVKDTAAESDWQIQIQSALYNRSAPLRFPEQELRDLLAVWHCGLPIPVSGPYLSIFGITHLYIDNIQFQGKRPYYNLQFFTMQCSSDIPLELEPDDRLLSKL